MAVKQLPKLSELPEPPDRLVGDQERFDTMTFDSLKAQKKMVNEDLNKTFIPKLNEFAVDVNASVTAAAQSERNAAASATTAGNEANEAASSAATAGTKAGEAAQSAAGAKTSETNAAASKSAAAKSATDAATAQRGAEAARDEARNLANVGYASQAKAGLAKVDGKTTQADAGGMITVKDVAIGGDAADLASARGQIGTPPIRSFTKTSADDSATLNLNDDKWWVNGEYVLYLRGGSSYGGFSFTPDVNNTPITVSSNYCVRMKAVNLYNNGSAAQEFSIAVGGSYLRKFYRTKFRTSDSTITYYPWKEAILQTSIGDGILFTDGKISVPEYQGATSSAPGTSGLVPPAAAGEQDLFLTGGAVYKAALTKITDSVASTASDTAASAKAVKSAYDRGSAGITAAGNAQTAAATAQAAANNALNVANSKLPLSGGNVVGAVSISGQLTVGPSPGSTTGEGGEIHLDPGSNGSYPAIIDATANRIRFFGKPGVPAVEVDLETGKFRGDIVGNANHAGWADNAGYANSAGYANARFIEAIPLNTQGTGMNLPAGGTWLVYTMYYVYGGEQFEVNGRNGPWLYYQSGGSWVDSHRVGFALRIA